MQDNLDAIENHFTIHCFISAGLKRVWETLTQPELVEKFMFGSVLKTTWKIGSPVEFFESKNHPEKLLVKGIVLRNQFPFHLEYTLFPVGWEMEDHESNYITVHFELKPSGAQTKLSITQERFKTVAFGEKRFIDAKKGWETILPILKSVAES